MKNITMEMSLKPFKKTDDAYIKKVCRDAFFQWKPLLKNAETASVMLWAADGSEILDYRGNDGDSFEWAYFVGEPNYEYTEWYKDHDPEGISLHTEGYYYTNDVPVMTYGILKKIVACLKEEGRNILNKEITVGATFDVGPEFAKSDFKYNRHREICTGNAMGPNTMVCCYEKLNGDDVCYAGFPNGIPQDTPFGTFFGRQTQIFLSDMDMDFIWFSNGLGFGRETWDVTGDIFDGDKFHAENLQLVKDSVMEFWHLFRKECPDYQIRVRGTNMTVGIDLASDGVPLKTIYESVENLLPPPNSPWAALDGDFGLELTGYMSRMAELPGDEYLFRYYVHDPWWNNSPWYDRYGGQPHDIYLPMSIGRIDENGKMCMPTHMHLLSIDNSWGDLPDACANEPIPHLIKAIKDAPDAPSPVVWVYPFREYCDADNNRMINKMYHLDWFIRGCINNGAPISSIISTDNFLKTDKSLFDGSVLVTAVPQAGSKFERKITADIENGLKVIFFGDVSDASEEFLKLCGIEKASGKSGELDVTLDGKHAGVIKHDEFINAGKIDTVAASGEAFAMAGDRAIGVKNKSCIWLRGTASIDRIKYSDQGRLPVPHNDAEYFIGERLMLNALSKFGLEISYDKPLGEKSPVMMISRSDNAWIYSVYTPSTTVKTTLKHPLGAPVLLGYQTKLENGRATYNFPKAEHKECRIFIEQQDGVVGAEELTPVCYTLRRQIKVTGLKNATVRFFPEEYCKNDATAVLNWIGYYIRSEKFDFEIITDEFGTYLEARNVTGNMAFQMPDVKHNGVIDQQQRTRGAANREGKKFRRNTIYM
ncbi:MAG: hypothetical protein J6C82_07620 [Clostridia bacterium]|nr:hypothetical protein [Clostridia bacterium]